MIDVVSHAYFVPVSEKNKKIHREEKKNARDAKFESEGEKERTVTENEKKEERNRKRPAK